jgi:hypothetical protein
VVFLPSDIDLEAELGRIFTGEFRSPVSIFDMTVDVVATICFCFDDVITLLAPKVVVVVVVLVVRVGARGCSPSLEELKGQK